MCIKKNENKLRYISIMLILGKRQWDFLNHEGVYWKYEPHDLGKFIIENEGAFVTSMLGL